MEDRRRISLRRLLSSASWLLEGEVSKELDGEVLTLSGSKITILGWTTCQVRLIGFIFLQSRVDRLPSVTGLSYVACICRREVRGFVHHGWPKIASRLGALRCSSGINHLELGLLATCRIHAI